VWGRNLRKRRRKAICDRDIILYDQKRLKRGRRKKMRKRFKKIERDVRQKYVRGMYERD